MSLVRSAHYSEIKPLCNDVRGEFILNAGDRIFEGQLLLFQTAQRQLIRAWPCLKGGNRLVQIPMLALEHLQADAQHVFVAHFGRGVHGALKSF